MTNVHSGHQRFCPECSTSKSVIPAQRICVVCGKPVPQSRGRRGTCSEECTRLGKRYYRQNWDYATGNRASLPDGKLLWMDDDIEPGSKQPTRSIVTAKVCEVCGKEFIGGVRAKYCPDCKKTRITSNRKDYQKKYYLEHRGKNVKDPKIPRK